MGEGPWGSERDVPFHLPSDGCLCFQVASMLLDHNADPSQPYGNPQQGSTLLHVVCWSGHTDIANLMLQHGSNLNIADAAGRTPLHLCCSTHDDGRMTDRTQVMRCLLKTAGASNPSIEDAEGLTALDYLVRSVSSS